MNSTTKQHSSLEKNGYTFSIVIPTWNNLPYLKLCLESIDRHAAYRHQIIVHVNQGSDGTENWLRENGYLDISASDENIGVCYALNNARKLVRSDYLLYMNDDMYACPNWDVSLVQAIESYATNQFFISGTLMQPGPFKDKSVISESNFGGRIESFGEKRLLAEWDKAPHPDWCGATWPPNVVHVDIWDAVGGYSVEFSPGMYSDPDFSMKLWRLGIREFRGVSSSRVYHFESVSTGRVKKNPGSKQFLLKWGITNSTFGRHYLRRGKSYTGPLTNPKLTLRFIFDILRSKIKYAWYRLQGLFN